MANDRIVLGQTGEKAAILFLKARGYSILETNYRTRHAEIDIIAKQSDTLCFIEVKTRKSLKKGLPRESVTYSKQKKIILGATWYLKEKNCNDSKIRFDVIEVYQKNHSFNVHLIEHAFQAV